MLENCPPNITHLDDLMEDFFKLLLTKRRTSQLSSNSSLDTSPEHRNLKNGTILILSKLKAMKVTIFSYLL